MFDNKVHSRAQVTTLYLISFNLIKTRFGFLVSRFFPASVVILDQWCSLYLFFQLFFLVSTFHIKPPFWGN